MGHIASLFDVRVKQAIKFEPIEWTTKKNNTHTSWLSVRIKKDEWIRKTKKKITQDTGARQLYENKFTPFRMYRLLWLNGNELPKQS